MNENPVLKLPGFRVPESNVFLMTRFRETPQHKDISDAVEEAVEAFGLKFLRADNDNLRDFLLWDKVQHCMEASHFGVAIFEGIDETDLNPNVSLELGYMMALKRECMLLKEQRLKELPADLCGHLYKKFDSYNIRPTVFGQIADWLKPIGVRKRGGEKLVVFVSYGGQDRCAIAKAITNHLLIENKSILNVRIESRGAESPSEPTAAQTAIDLVQKKLGRDWLGDHRPRRAGVAFLFEANLILATDREVLSKLLTSSLRYPGTDEDRRLVREEIGRKSHLLSKFFGGPEEDLEDPYPDHGDAKSRQEYQKCVDDLYQRISRGFSALTEFLERDDPPKTKLRSVSFGDRHLVGTSML